MLASPVLEAPALKPPLKWAGGKRWLVEHLRPLWEQSGATRLVEPFCGGLAIALGLQPQQALLNDVNPHLINFYRQLQNGLVLQLCPPTLTLPPSPGPSDHPLPKGEGQPSGFENDRAYYGLARDRFNALIRAGQFETPEAARLFYYLNRTGFNGLCRFNSKGLFNVPFGSYKTINYPADLLAYQPVLQPWTFTLDDFEDFEAQITPTDFVYADPPYDVEFVSYSAGGFNWDDQKRLAHWLAKLPCPVVASNQATDRIIALYKDLGFTITRLDAPRRIACNGDRRPALEMLASKGI